MVEGCVFGRGVHSCEQLNSEPLWRKNAEPGPLLVPLDSSWLFLAPAGYRINTH